MPLRKPRESGMASEANHVRNTNCNQSQDGQPANKGWLFREKESKRSAISTAAGESLG